jgi:hypothetical protein
VTVNWEVPYYGFDGFLGFWEEGKLGKALGFEVGFYCRKICQCFCDNPRSVTGASELD